jgi:protein-S-isoprenylcysteine O-methyltransferase Ste14
MTPLNNASMQTSSHRDHDQLKDLCDEHPYGHAGQITGMILFLIIWSLDSFIFKFSTMPASYIPFAFRLGLGTICFLVSAYFALKAHRVIFDEVRDPARVIDTGVFSRVRHPLYLSVLLVYVGLFFTTLSLYSLAIFIIVFLFYDFIARFEEKKLLEAFGEAYGSYLEKTPKWLPRFRSQISVKTKRADQTGTD